MFSLFWKSLFTALLFLLLWINIAFAFNVLDIMNPTNVFPDGQSPSDYYFGVSSFIDQFKFYFTDNTVLLGFQDFLSRFGRTIGFYYRDYVEKLSALFGWSSSAWEIFAFIIAVILLLNDIIPMFMMILMGLFYMIYLLMFAFEIVLFIVAFFGGAFATPLPNTDWWEYTPTINALAMLPHPTF